MKFHAPSGRLYERDMDLIEVTMLNRPDEAWTFIDPAGHEHFWLFDGVRGRYSPLAKAEVPTLVQVKDGEQWWDDDGEPHDIWHYECGICGAVVVPGCKPDETRQFIPGQANHYIDGESVSKETFDAAVKLELERLQNQ